jgi:para-nitrobenzyl esterase
MIATMTPKVAFSLLAVCAVVRGAGLDTIVKTEGGLLAGGGVAVRSYKGIPFAAAPTGALRWKAPQPAKPWDGVRVARTFGAVCPQVQLMAGAHQQSEDCLTLNVWTPARSPAEKLPVMVWIHGGAFMIGASSQTVYDGEPLASQGVVVVSLNYRLGIFGFLAHPALSKESAQGVSGNYGLLDMIAGLEWVKRNIGAFGGDPANVTIFGESAGGSAVCLLMVTPASKGLFAKAISQSAAWMNTAFSYLKESRNGRIAAEAYGARFGDDVDALRKLSAADVLKKVGMPNMSDSGAADRGESYLPVVDGVVLPDDPTRLFETGRSHAVAFIAGTNGDEGMLLGGPPVRSLAALKKWAEAQFGRQADALMAVYPAATDDAAHGAAAGASGDYLFLQGTRVVLRASAKANPKTFQYHFTRVNGVGRRIKWGAFHAAEIPYVFGTLPDSAYGTTPTLFGDFSPQPGDYDAVDAKLTAAMSAAWVRFAKTGDPNGPGLARWPKFSDGSESYLEFGDEIAAKASLHKRQLDVLSDIGAAKSGQSKLTSGISR